MKLLLKVGDLVQLQKEEFSMWGIDRSNVGLVLSVDNKTRPESVTVLWNSESEPHDEYADGLELVPLNGA